jgi:hypothetical protein
MFFQLFIIILFLFFLFYIFIIEPNLIKIKQYQIKIDKSFSLKSNLTIIHISDLHIIRFGWKELYALNKIKEINPDIILITGDLVGNVKGLNATLSFLNSLRSKYGIFAVFGNEEYQSLYYSQIKKLIDSNIKILNNEHYQVVLENGEKITLIGVDDPVFNRDDLEKAILNLPKEGIRILLAHSPEIINKYKEKLELFKLILCGHVHGGQVRLPLIGPILLPKSCPRRYNKGLYKLGKSYLFVNKGIGTCPLTIRFLCPPEISILRLK